VHAPGWGGNSSGDPGGQKNHPAGKPFEERRKSETNYLLFSVIAQMRSNTRAKKQAPLEAGLVAPLLEVPMP